MNLPAHGTTSPEQVRIIAYNNSRKSDTCSIIAYRSLSAAKQNLCRLLGGAPLPPGATPLTDPLLQVYHLVEHTLPPGATWCRDLSR